MDRRKDGVVARAARQHDDPLAFLRDPDLFGDLVDDARFTAAYTRALTDLHERGAVAAIEGVLVPGQSGETA